MLLYHGRIREKIHQLNKSKGFRQLPNHEPSHISHAHQQNTPKIQDELRHRMIRPATISVWKGVSTKKRPGISFSDERGGTWKPVKMSGDVFFFGVLAQVKLGLQNVHTVDSGQVVAMVNMGVKLKLSWWICRVHHRKTMQCTEFLVESYSLFPRNLQQDLLNGPLNLSI